MPYGCGGLAVGSRASWAGAGAGPGPLRRHDRPVSAHLDRFYSAFDNTNSFQYVSGDGEQERLVGQGDIVVKRKSSSLERADCALAAHAPLDDDWARETVLYAQARQLYPLQEDLADWINKTIDVTYITGENFLHELDNGAALCQLAAVVHDAARAALDQGLIVGPVPVIPGRCWQRAARRSFFSRDNTDNFLSFCRALGVHENLLFESDDLVLHNQPRQVILCLLEVARLAARLGIEPPGLVQLEREIALEERDSGLHSAASWQFREEESVGEVLKSLKDTGTSTESYEEPNESQLALDNTDAESTKSGGTVASSDSDVPLRPTNELDKRVQLVTRLMERGCQCGAGRCSKLLKVKKVGEGRYNIAGRNVFIRLLKGRHMMVRVGGGWDTLEHFLSRHEPCQVRLVAAGRGGLLPVPLATPSPAPSTSPGPPLAPSAPSSTPSRSGSKSPMSSLPSKSPPSSREPSIPGSVSPIGNRTPSLSGKASPVRTSTPKPARSALSLPLKDTTTSNLPIRTRKQSAPSSAAASPRTPPAQLRKSLTANTLTLAPKKSRSMSLALAPTEKKLFCGTERLNQTKKSGAKSAATTPTDTPRKARSQSLASTPVEMKKPVVSSGYGLKSRSMSLVGGERAARPASGLTQAVIEESIRQSLAATLAEDHCKKPFLHIKAKYRSPPPREVPPR